MNRLLLPLPTKKDAKALEEFGTAKTTGQLFVGIQIQLVSTQDLFLLTGSIGWLDNKRVQTETLTGRLLIPPNPKRGEYLGWALG